VKIGILYDAIYPDVIGGGEKRNWEIARRMVERGHEVWLISMQYWAGKPVEVREGVHCAGVAPAIPLMGAPGRRSLREPFYFARHVSRFLKDHEFDAIECMNFPYLSCFPAARAMRRAGRPLVMTWFEARGLRGWLRHAGWRGLPAACVERMLPRLTDCHTAISPFTARRMENMFPRLRGRVRVIPCGVEQIDAADGARRRHQLLWVGRLRMHKRADWLLDLMQGLCGETPDARLHIVGDGEYRPLLEAQIRARGLDGCIHIHPYLSDAALARLRAESGAFLFSSRQEGFGMVVVEAMAAGLPVIAARSAESAASELIEDGRNGLLAADRREWAAAIRRLFADDELWNTLRDGGRRTAEGYDWDCAVLPAYETALSEWVACGNENFRAKTGAAV
jgi:glycosyltransferase involved in cell wall biosynthesis